MTGTLPPYRSGLAAALLSAREGLMAPIRPLLREAGLSEQQWRVLRVLEDEGAMETMSLSERALLHAPSVTRILKDLVERRLVDRLPVENDARRSLVSINQDGRALIQQTAMETRKILDLQAQAFGPERLQNLTRELQAFAIALQGESLPEGNE
ncbi:MAG: MarR family transcriptional regulator [Hyphomonadaceae bacterium]|nr:MarR family transcriptional regulator [Hyphomonadaceae bacterium]